ncbi:MAG: hypothetical protein WC789_04760 [Lentisphaeria bacterium]
MKTITSIILMILVAVIALASDKPLVPDGINQILGRIQPNMSESQVETLMKKYYPDVKRTLGTWSGQTGYVDFKVSPAYTISIAEYNDPKDFNLRFVHADMIIYVFEWQTKTRLNLSFFKWDDGENKDKKNTEPAGGASGALAAGAPSAHP